MNRMCMLVMMLAVLLYSAPGGKVRAQEDKSGAPSRLSSAKLDVEGKALDEQIIDLNRRIEGVISKYKLMDTKDIRILPFQITYTLGNGFIEMERHSFEKNELLDKIIRLKKKSIKIYTSGSGVTKIESRIFERDYNSNLTTEVFIIDSSPSAAGTDDIVFTHALNGKKLLDVRRLGEVKNTTAFPVRNDIKREFLVPHLSYFYNVILNIAETYAKSVKDSDSMMAEFLRSSTVY